MKNYSVVGGGGTRLHVIENGNPQGHPILFLHGFSQCGLAWSRQLNSDLAQDHRLVAMDLRGHGQSDKPRDAYADSKLWADDVRAVLHTLKLEQPILSGWSYGPLVISITSAITANRRSAASTSSAASASWGAKRRSRC